MRCLKIFIIYALLQVFVSVTANTANTADSLKALLNKTSDYKVKQELYRNLADIYLHTPNEVYFLDKLYKFALESGSHKLALNTLYDLSLIYMDKNKSDSAAYYYNIISEFEDNPDANRLKTYLSMCMFNVDINDQTKKDIENMINNIKSEHYDNNDIYNKIKQAYVIALSLFYKDQFADALPYINNAVSLVKELPLEQGIDYKVTIIRLQARIYTLTGQNEKAISLLEDMIAMKEKYVEQYVRSQRPFYNMDDFYVRNYTTLMINLRYMPPKKVNYYMEKLAKLCENSSDSTYRYNFFLIKNNYYLSTKDYTNVLSTNDSLIKYAKTMAPYNVASLYERNSKIYEHQGNYPAALSALRASAKFKDSIDKADASDKMTQLQVQYDVNELKYENSQLELRNKRTLITALTLLLLITVIICVYLYTNLKKEKMLKEKLRYMKIKADEGKAMKDSFIKSVCHEIRTPLNAIVGFSDILTDTTMDIDKESKEMFSKEISHNTKLLTSLIDSIIEVANLDISEDKLDCIPTDISLLCYNQIDNLRAYMNKDINCVIEISESPMIIPANAHYFSLILSNLLSNAKKFTESGQITLTCIKYDQFVRISVTDTGCGIPEDMHEAVFERFTKIHTYKQGSGLGLYLCRLIAKRHGGSIYIDSSYKTGTRMVVELPIHY